jgi:exonuclease III
MWDININCLPVTKNNQKVGRLFQAIQNYNPDAILLQEMGFNTLVTPKSKQWKALVAEHLDIHRVKTIHASNVNDMTGNRKQWGGTAVLTQGDMSFCYGLWADPPDSRRWRSRIRGQNNMITVSCYDRENRVINLFSPTSVSPTTSMMMA